MRGQLSAEMLILIVVVLAVLALVASQVLGIAQQGSQRAGQQSEDIFNQIGETKLPDGAACQKDSNCENDNCYNGYCR